MNRFLWLEKEARAVKTNGAFVFSGGKLVRSRYALPPGLRDFLRRFGAARMYRQRTGRFLLSVCPPVLTEWNSVKYLKFGVFGFSRGAFLRILPDEEVGAVVYELRGKRLVRAAANFEIWLRSSARAAKQKLGVRYWKELVDGPVPFSAKESEILAARAAFRWERLGSTASGATRLRIKNGSNRRLPFLTFSIRDRAGKTTGRVRVAIGDILPGQSALVECDFYRKHIAGADLVVELDDPDPSERRQFWEFRALRA